MCLLPLCGFVWFSKVPNKPWYRYLPEFCFGYCLFKEIVTNAYITSLLSSNFSIKMKIANITHSFIHSLIHQQFMIGRHFSETRFEAVNRSDTTSPETSLWVLGFILSAQGGH